MIDDNGDGFLDKKELMNVLKAIQKTTSIKEIDEMMKIADQNKDGKIDFDEFLLLNAYINRKND